ncbi:MAG TPA: preprotein translocase subunit SecA [bacterium]|nr:preprotein translocase subunit SecA [bacterium]
MLEFVLKKIFGTKHEKDIKQLRPLIEEISALEPDISKLNDEELRAKTEEFRSRVKEREKEFGEEIKGLRKELSSAVSPKEKAKIKVRLKDARNRVLENILPEAFAVVREAGKRTINMRHFDVQLMGGIILHQGKNAEMATGEGKTLVATLNAYLNGLTGEGVHIITVNDYLARRDTEWMGSIYDFLGLSVGCIQHDKSFLFDLSRSETGKWEMDKVGSGIYLRPVSRQEAYQADITYGTNNEFGFDYLRDNMAIRIQDRVQRKLNYAIVDEVDCILIDEARTPLIISGPAEESTDKYIIVERQVILRLQGKKVTEEEEREAKKTGVDLEKDYDYIADEKAGTIKLTEQGIANSEKILNVEDIYAPPGEWAHHITQGLRAKEFFRRDHHYMVKDGQVIIVDEFTGRLMPGRRWSEGLHQAIEAKENVEIARENQTLATITFQNYFRMYDKLAGMTGTAATEAGEFNEIYKLDVVVIPTNKPLIRYQWPDVIYKTEEEKFKAAVEEITKLHKEGRPVLVGTVSIEKSEYLSSLLRKKGIPHEVLNAKNHEREAHIIAKAGQRGSVTISTNMAGRGTDIVLGEGIARMGGLHVLGTERHEARRVDNQLRGRSGRQGDPGSSRFYLSLQDDLMRLFGSDRISFIMDKLHIPSDQPIEHALVTRAITTAQKRVEQRNFEIRKHLLEYDDVMEKQRDYIYRRRREILEKEDQSQTIKEWMEGILDSALDTHILEKAHPEDWDIEGLNRELGQIFPIALRKEDIDLSRITREDLKKILWDAILKAYQEKEERISPEGMRALERDIMLHIVDSRWKDHLYNLDHLKEGIGLRGYGQRDPLLEYKRESFDYFTKLCEAIPQEGIALLFKVRLPGEAREREAPAKRHFVHQRYSTYDMAEAKGEVRQPDIKGEPEAKPLPFKRRGKKIGRNEPCPCGSGKKYKHCCGK